MKKPNPYFQFLILLIIMGFLSCGKSKNNFNTNLTLHEKSVSELSNGELLEHLTLKSINLYYSNNSEEVWNLARDELVKRKAIDPLINTFKKPVDSCQKEYVVQALSSIDDKEIYQLFKKNMSAELTENNFYILGYLAEKGDLKALKILNDNYYEYPVSSDQWSDIVRLFGQYNYRPSIPNLIQSLDARSGNVSSEAFGSLCKMFKDDRPKFKSIEEGMLYFTRLNSSSKSK